MPLPTALEQSGLNNGVVVDTIDSLEGPFSLPGTHSPNAGSFITWVIKVQVQCCSMASRLPSGKSGVHNSRTVTVVTGSSAWPEETPSVRSTPIHRKSANHASYPPKG